MTLASALTINAAAPSTSKDARPASGNTFCTGGFVVAKRALTSNYLLKVYLLNSVRVFAEDSVTEGVCEDAERRINVSRGFIDSQKTCAAGRIALVKMWYHITDIEKVFTNGGRG